MFISILPNINSRWLFHKILTQAFEKKTSRYIFRKSVYEEPHVFLPGFAEKFCFRSGESASRSYDNPGRWIPGYKFNRHQDKCRSEAFCQQSFHQWDG